jgi:hypothetical protein
MRDADVRMRKNKLIILVAVVVAGGAAAFAAEGNEVSQQRAQAFVGQDLQLSGHEVMSYKSDSGEHILVFQGVFSMSIGANQFHSNSAVIWVKGSTTEFLGESKVDYKVKAYLEGNVSVKKGESAKTTDLSRAVIEDSKSMAVQFNVSGEVFVTADKREDADPRGLELYKRAEAVVVPSGPKFVVQPEAIVPELPKAKIYKERPSKQELAAVPAKPKKGAAAVSSKPLEEAVVVPPETKKAAATAASPEAEKKSLPATSEGQKQPGLLEMMFGGGGKAAKPAEAVAEKEEKGPRFRYPVNIAPAGTVEPNIERTTVPDGTDIATVVGRFYVWQKQDEAGGLLELEADSAVIFYSGAALSDKEKTKEGEVFAGSGVQAIYMSGDVVMTEGQRTIRADEMYYDFQDKKAIAVNAVVRNFDEKRGIPIYVRAVKLRRVAEDKFSAENAVVTSSEFYLPQISLTASSVFIADTTAIDAQKGRVSRDSYDVQMRDVRFKYGERTLFYWPYMRANFERPDVPIKSFRVGSDHTWGTFVETQWYLARLLGLREPEGTDSTFALDYYSERGLGTGAEINYSKENYYGTMLGYIIRDSGEDNLGRTDSRRDLQPPNELRGRFSWEHRQYLPDKWQLTAAVSYLSDKNFLESFYRNEFAVGHEQETYVHLKRIQDNWGLSILGKTRINNFEDKLEELPTAEFHWTGQSFLDDKLTFYSDSQVSRFRQLYGSSPHGSQEFFSFASTRNEVDMPMQIGKVKVVPFAAGTVAHDDGQGFHTDIDGSAVDSKDNVWIGEGGVRASVQPYWKIYPNVKSRLWDVNQLRHIVSPYVEAVDYTASSSVAEQRDTVSAGISQRLQTKRGTGDKTETVDWMRLDTDITWVNHQGDTTAGPDRFIWNRPFIPLVDPFGTSRDRRSSSIFGPSRNSFCADYMWRMSDTTALLSDMDFDIKSKVAQQFDIGFSRMCWPNLSYYVGTRYLRRFNNGLGQKGSNMFTFAVTYEIDPRYTLAISQQTDFAYGKTVRSDISLIRRYHRVYWALTYSSDKSLKSDAVVFSIWPQGIPGFGFGKRNYTNLTSGAEGY